ncbi:MAG: hypothetical protein M9888_04865 [Chitinophagales bacterium]|nr:hypothetical protein [Chitinophagales bacterium]
MMEHNINILIFDSNTTRGENIVSLLKRYDLSATHHRQFNGQNVDSLTGVWSNHKEFFDQFINLIKYIFIHYSNDQFNNAVNGIPQDKIVIVYSGGADIILGNKNENVFAFQGKVSDDATTEWDLEAFALALKNGGNVFEALQSFDPKLEALLEPFATSHPLTTPTAELKTKKAELQAYVNTKLGK